MSFGQFDVNLYGTNITNESDYQTVFNIVPGAAYGVVLRPRTYGLNVRWNF